MASFDAAEFSVSRSDDWRSCFRCSRARSASSWRVVPRKAASESGILFLVYTNDIKYMSTSVIGQEMRSLDQFDYGDSFKMATYEEGREEVYINPNDQ